jgi:hypothetical protein
MSKAYSAYIFSKTGDFNHVDYCKNVFYAVG